MTGVSLEVALAAGYALFLLLAAAGLARLARHSQRRAARYEVSGFRYHREPDYWECPTGQRLYRLETDYRERLVRYRAPAQVCSGCALRAQCTDSSEGREIEHRLDGWLDAELRRFHRVASLTLVGLAVLILTLAAARQHGPADIAVLALALAPVAAGAVRLLIAAG
jgi:DDE family transposase